MTLIANYDSFSLVCLALDQRIICILAETFIIIPRGSNSKVLNSSNLDFNERKGIERNLVQLYPAQKAVLGTSYSDICMQKA